MSPEKETVSQPRTSLSSVRSTTSLTYLTSRHEILKVALIFALIVFVSILHYRTSTNALYLHEIYQRVYYIPILLAAFWYGPLGGAAAATLTCLMYGYHIRMDWQGFPAYSINQYAEMVLFYAVGLIFGFLAMRERRQRQRLETASKDLSQAYEKIQETSEQLRRAERLAALGELTAGIAHEIRNPLASIKGAVDILDRGISSKHPQREFLEIIGEEIRRLDSTLNQFLGFARPREPNLRASSLREIVESCIALLREQAENISIRFEDSPRLPPVSIDPDQIKQVLLNVMLNGIQAMPQGGELRISADLDDRGDTVLLEVSDTGQGLRNEDLSRVFDPFFTTKPSGMGLGLSLSSRLIENHGGKISLNQNPGTGVTCRVELPVSVQR